MTGLLQLGIVFVAVSVLVAAGLSVFVYAGGSRRRSDKRRYVTFEDDGDVVPMAGSNKPTSQEDDGQAEPPREPEPAVTRPVHEDSGVLDRLLAGVQLPCGLERIQPEGEDESIRRSYLTTGYEPRVVAVSVVDELERLGMDVEPLSYTEARAHRDGFELAVTLYMEPRRVVRARRPAFPNAPDDGVVIEFSVA